MNKITQTIMSSLEKFYKEFVNYHPGDSGIGGNYPQEPVYELAIDPQSTEDIKALKSHLLQSQIELLETLIHQVQERKVTVWNDRFGYRGDDLIFHTKEEAEGWNKALEEQISSLNETLEFLKKSL